jgi:hypothetical protein
MDEGLPPIRVAVNLSSIQMLDPQLMDRLELCIAFTGADPNLLEVEVTESVLLEGSEQALATLHRMKDMGISLALDDFGTGYSSLSLARTDWQRLGRPREALWRAQQLREVRGIDPAAFDPSPGRAGVVSDVVRSPAEDLVR